MQYEVAKLRHWIMGFTEAFKLILEQMNSANIQAFSLDLSRAQNLELQPPGPKN